VSIKLRDNRSLSLKLRDTRVYEPKVRAGLNAEWRVMSLNYEPERGVVAGYEPQLRPERRVAVRGGGSVVVSAGG